MSESLNETVQRLGYAEAQAENFIEKAGGTPDEVPESDSVLYHVRVARHWLKQAIEEHDVGMLTAASDAPGPFTPPNLEGGESAFEALADANGIQVELPQSEPDQAGGEPDMSTATVLTVSTDGTMGDATASDHTTVQGAIDAAIALSGPVKIVLQNSDVFGSADMKPKTDNDWILIEPEDTTFLPAYGTRFRPSQSAHSAEFATTWGHDGSEMPVLKTGATNERVLEVDDASGVVGRYWFKGIKCEAGASTSSFIETLYSGSTASGATHHITFDRMWMDGVYSTFEVRHAIFGGGKHILVTGCTIERIAEAGAESHGWLMIDGPGPVLIEENFVECAAINFMFGGGDPKASETIPRDITIRRNQVHKDLAWKGANLAIKNFFEVKCAYRVLFEQNVCRNNWADGQTGKAFLIRANKQTGATDGVVETHDVTIRWNKVINSEQGYDILAQDGSGTVAVLNNANSVHDDLWISFGDKSSHTGVSSPDDLIFTDSVDGMFIANVTMVGASGTHTLGTDGGPTDPAFLSQDNIWGGDNAPGFYNWKASGTTQGADSLDANYGVGDWSVKKSVVIGDPNNPTPGTEQGPETEAGVDFVDLAGENYRLADTSPYKGTATDGGDPGCDIDELETNKINGIE